MNISVGNHCWFLLKLRIYKYFEAFSRSSIFSENSYFIHFIREIIVLK